MLKFIRKLRSRKSSGRFEDTLVKLYSIQTNDYNALSGVVDQWRDMAKEDLTIVDLLDETYLRFAAELASIEPNSRGSGKRDLEMYVYITRYCSLSYLRHYNCRKRAMENFYENHDEHLALIGTLMCMPDRQVTDKPLPTATGRLGDVVEDMISLYYWRKPYSGEVEGPTLDTSLLIPEFFEKFPSQFGGRLFDILEDHPRAVEEMAKLIVLFASKAGGSSNVKVPALGEIGQNMFGVGANREDYWHKNSAKVLARVGPALKNLPDGSVPPLVDELLLEPLSCEPITQKKAREDKQRQIEWYASRLSEPYETYLGIGAETLRELDEERLEKSKAELSHITTDFEGWLSKRRRNAVRILAVSQAKKKAFKAVLPFLPPPHNETISSLLDEVDELSSRPKKLPMPDKSDNQFKDLGIKLLVIELLMYQKKVLKPLFDVHVFAAEYTKREISVEDDGYEIIPEVKKWYWNLGIPNDLLKEVTTLHLSSGLDGGPVFIDHLWRFWDPGCGDEPIPVTNKAVADLELLPNLKSISGLENCCPPKKLLKALNGKGIQLIDEETATFG